MKSEIFNCDCMELMAKYPDNYWELAICDPPYGIGMSGGNVGYKGQNNFERKNWDSSIPKEKYFKELERVSKNQIIWGGNYFIEFLRNTRCIIIWDKGEGFYDRTYAECEIAWTSFDKNTIKYKHDPLAKGDYKGKIHPTQKPVALYKWLLKNYAKEGDKILDTHGGSMSSVIACLEMGFEITCCELDKDYFQDAKKRIIEHQKQDDFFTQKQEINFIEK